MKKLILFILFVMILSNVIAEDRPPLKLKIETDQTASENPGFNAMKIGVIYYLEKMYTIVGSEEECNYRIILKNYTKKNSYTINVKIKIVDVGKENSATIERQAEYKLSNIAGRKLLDDKLTQLVVDKNIEKKNQEELVIGGIKVFEKINEILRYK